MDDVSVPIVLKTIITETSKMNRSSKGFGLAGVLATVLFLVVTAAMTSSANSQTLTESSATQTAQQ